MFQVTTLDVNDPPRGVLMRQEGPPAAPEGLFIVFSPKNIPQALDNRPKTGIMI